ncbi:hypothetical protein SASPL_149005 [Salvia splendens]|uniref:DUF4219 domain-containing protein n=1 Tax=Salvia splendens TaxID=180675 RepID=A0A8X8WAE9_SALSN|nr:hypothetical protein SASPL_149005 [Salvia splendens]
MNGGSSISVDKLVANKYNYWKLCMEAYLQGHDLWDLISGEDKLPEDTPQNGEARRKWKIKCGKALFALRTSIRKDYIEHVQLDEKGAVNEARLRRHLIRGLREEFMPFISSIYGWVNQPSIIELENLLSNQEALVKQIFGGNNQSSSRVEEVLYAKDKGKSRFTSKSPLTGAKAPNPVADADTCVNISIYYNYEWIVDSRCSHHATGNDSLLSGVRPHNQKKVIVTADNSLHPVVNEGQFFIEKDVSLEDVYHVPGLKKNLASVSQIADSGREMIRYVLSANEAYTEKPNQYDSATLWHARLDHVGFQLLQKISEKKLLEGVPVYCLQMKHILRNQMWCMDPETKKVVISRDVVFDEISFDQIDANDRSVTTDLLPILDDVAPSDRGSISTSPEENLQQDETTEAGTQTTT